MLKKVLTVDDSDMVRTMYRLALRHFEDCRVVAANNGREALERLAEESGYDLILLDVNMPVMNGLEFLETFKRKRLPLPAPVIVVSAEGQEVDVKQAMALGATGNLIKPFQSGSLLDLVDAVFGAERERPASPADAAVSRRPF